MLKLIFYRKMAKLNDTNSKKGDLSDIEDWGNYMSAKKSKLQNQFYTEAKKNEIVKNIFNGTSIFVNGYTRPTADELKHIMMDYGGVYHHYFTNNKTAYMIASNLPAVKIKQFMNSNVKIVKPEWITDSIEAGKMLDYKSYLLLSDFCKHQSITNFQNNINKDKLVENISASKSTVELNINEMSENVPLRNDAFQVDSDKFDSMIVSKSLDCNLELETSEAKDISEFKNSHKTASDENFLEEFYNNSRLHHISTMGATFKQYVNDLRSKKVKEYPRRERLKKWKMENNRASNEKMNWSTERCIMHIDMDCFFVSVGLRNRTDLKGLPVAVTHAKGNKVANRDSSNRKAELNLHEQRYKEKYNSEDVKPWFADIGEFDSMSEIASCSYEARKSGIKNGMLLGQAFKLCPSLKTIPYDFNGYKEVSYSLYNHVASYTLDIEAVSCDEMYVDCTEMLFDTKIDVLDFATILRDEIKEMTGCPCSTGFGPNRLMARLATKKAKPDGQYHVTTENVKNFIQYFLVSDLPGIGHSITFKLNSMGVKTCEDIQNVPLTRLQQEFGNKAGLTLYRHSFGEDDKPLNFSHQRKSVSAEVNYGIRFKNQSEAEIFLKKLVLEVESRLNFIKMKGKSVTLKLMVKAANAPSETAKFLGHGICDYVTKSASLFEATSDSDVILREVLKIFLNLKVDPIDLRGIGIQMSRLEQKKPTLKSVINLDKFVVKTKRLDNKEYFAADESSNDAIKANDEKSNDMKMFDESAYDISFSQIDPDYLNALPNNIKKEIIVNSKRKRKRKINEYDLQDSEFFYNYCIIEENNVPRIKSSFPPTEISKAINAWVTAEKTPQQCDIEMLSYYLKQFLLNGEFESVNFIIDNFERITNYNDHAEWKIAYQHVTNVIREAMAFNY